MPSKILFTWLGRTDIRASKGELDYGIGPIAEAVKTFDYKEVHILTDASKAENEDFEKWLEDFTKGSIELHHHHLSNPMSFGEIYEAAVKTLEQVTEPSNSQNSKSSNHQIVFHISPGTPAMAAIWIILSKTQFPAELVQSSMEEGAQIISIPFELAADYSPALMLGNDDELLRITQGLPPQVVEFDAIIHKCKEMKDAVNKSRIVALHDIPVLLNGESGTGKELFARAIHASSKRKQGPFIEVNCGAIPENLFESEFFGHEKGAFTGANKAKQGYIESANGGTLFLDEIGELPLYAQVKLLRAIQEQSVVKVGTTTPIPVNIRIISATNRTLVNEIANGNFREDLFHRLAIGVLQLPPLRKRQGDLSLLIDSFMNEINDEFRQVHKNTWKDRKLSANAKHALLQHAWPGNIRELRNTLSRLILWAEKVTIRTNEVHDALFKNHDSRMDTISFTDFNQPNFNLESYLGKIALQYIDHALNQTGGKKSPAAQLLGFANYQTMDNWISKYRGVN